ncbi:hypothetical protein CA3LBN_003906 [Candidozyma haemuli]|uniref:Protein EFR3 n=1 Tax=Candidozyma haemuli TaxID=45357 RepID=A0ABX8IAP6_9ASCO|nr:hypothetical protein CA3LBN_003906 [[Candida] haemuloni]
MSDDLFGPPDPYFNPVDHPSLSTWASNSSNIASGRFYQRAFGDTRLSNSLALIVYSAQCGYSDTDSIPAVLISLKNAIYESLLHCVSVDRPTYTHYIQQLSKKSDVLITRLIIPALTKTSEQPGLVVGQSIIKEVHELVNLLYGFTNPLKIPGVLSDDHSVDGPHGLRLSSFHTVTLLSVARKLQSALNSQIMAGDTKVVGSNSTPLNMWNEWMASSSSMVTRLIVTILNNTVPTATVFVYFEDLLRQEGVDILDLEYFDEFLSHFQRINDFAKTQKNSALFNAQRLLIQDHFLRVIRSFPCHPLSWCTAAQTVNYLQVYIDIYNDVYNDKLLIEKLADQHESTVVKRAIDSDEVPDGHFLNYLSRSRLASKEVPVFVKYFEEDSDSTETREKELRVPVSQPKNSESFRKASQKNVDCYLNGTAANSSRFSSQNHRKDLPQDPIYLKVFRLNEEVAHEVRELRAMVEEQIHKGSRRSCWKCKCVPWHKHRRR